jgi:hypothetical protein
MANIAFSTPPLCRKFPLEKSEMKLPPARGVHAASAF